MLKSNKVCKPSQVLLSEVVEHHITGMILIRAMIRNANGPKLIRLKGKSKDGKATS